MTELSPRIKLTPQMQDYDNLAMPWLPYVMYLHESNYRSSSVNTDGNGLRFSTGPTGETVCVDDIPGECGILVGGSTAFGVGATMDSATIASHLAALGGYPWVNLGVRAYGPAQEIMLFLTHSPKIAKIRRIVLFSGLNALVIRLLSRNTHPDLPPFYFQSRFQSTMNRASLSPKRRMLATALGWVAGDVANWGRESGTAILTKVAKALFNGQTASSPQVEDSQLIRLAIADQIRYLRSWRLLAQGLNCELVFALQPFADWLDRLPCPEEQALFAYLETLPGNTFQFLRNALGCTVHSQIATALQDYCTAENIPFIDTNPALAGKSDWLFVDRIHLTDLGNREIAQVLHGKGS